MTINILLNDRSNKELLEIELKKILRNNFSTLEEDNNKYYFSLNGNEILNKRIQKLSEIITVYYGNREDFIKTIIFS